MKKLPKKNEIVDQIMKDLKKSNLPLLNIDAEIAHVKKRIIQWEDARDNAQTPEKRAYYEESVEICKVNLENKIQEKKEIVDATMGLIRLAVRCVIETICYRSEIHPIYECKSDRIVLFTKRKPFDVEAIEKFGSEITFSIPIKEGNLKDFRISNLVPRHNRARSRKQPNLVTVYFSKLDKQVSDTPIIPTGFPKD